MLGRERTLTQPPKFPSAPAAPLPDPYADTSPDYRERCRKTVTTLLGFKVETYGAPLPTEA